MERLAFVGFSDRLSFKWTEHGKVFLKMEKILHGVLSTEKSPF